MSQQVFAAFAHTPSTHAAAENEFVPMSHSQHVGRQSRYVEHAAPFGAVPLSSGAGDQQRWFTCSEPLEITVVLFGFVAVPLPAPWAPP